MAITSKLLAISLVSIVLQSALACLCVRVPTLRVLFYGPSKNLVRAKVIGIRGAGFSATYIFRTEQNYKGCPPPKVFFYKAAGTSCDVAFEKGASYIFALRPGPKQVFNACGYQPRYDSLSNAERDFLSGREVCCKGLCKCVRHPPPIACLIAPCDPIMKPPCEEAVKCVDTKCAPCQAEWLTATGEAACEPPFPN